MEQTRKKTVTTITEAEIDRQAQEMKNPLHAMPQVKVRIPRISSDPNRPNDLDKIPVPVTINGYTYSIKRGETVEVPEEVARILEESGYLG